jgi:hypothetical protein
MSTIFRSYDDFFLFYLSQHSRRANRLLHLLGTTVALGMTLATIVLHHPWLALLWIPVGYAFAWAGHLMLEGNRPATWGHPWWSFISDFRMIGLMLTGRLDAWLTRAEAVETPSQTATADAQD